jgi:hypothetical protein
MNPCCDQAGSGEYEYCDRCGFDGVCCGCGLCENCDGEVE